MNYSGSYRRLLGNSKAAVIATIEIYNKPYFQYRDESCAVLLMNAWELILKAILSKHRKSIYRHKLPKQKYHQTLSWAEALKKAEEFIPKEMIIPISHNLKMLAEYRNNAIHFYNEKGFGRLLYSLFQTGIVNYKDILKHQFKVKLEDEIDWQLLPLGLYPPIDPIEYIGGKVALAQSKQSSFAIRQFLTDLKLSYEEIETAGYDKGRLLTMYDVKLVSNKKISHADILVGVTKDDGESVVIERPVDPNKSYPLRQTEICSKIDFLHDRKFTGFLFQAIVWKYEIKSNSHLCMEFKTGKTTLFHYSNDIIPFIKNLSAKNIEEIYNDYKLHLRGQRHNKKIN